MSVKKIDRERHWMLLGVTMVTVYLTKLQPDVLPHFVAAIVGASAVEWFRGR